MGNKKSLTYLISKYAIIELIYTFFLIILFYIGLNLLIHNGLVYPANYADINSDKIESMFQSDNWSIKQIPFYYDFLYMENGEQIHNSIDKKYDKQVMEAIKNGRAASNEIVGTSIFKAYTRKDKQLVLRYKISLIPTSEKVYAVFENVELLYIATVLSIWFLGFSLLLIHSSNLLKKEIHKIAIANDNITQMNLDYPRESSNYKEIDGVLNSINILAKNLKDSLNKQWDMQMKQKELIESVTHDIRTPITLIKGNVELLKEENEENKELTSDRFVDISNGIARLEQYINKLKEFSYTMDGKKDIVSDEIISYWTDIMKSICRTNDLHLKIIKSECSNIYLDKEVLAVALQNIIINCVQHSPKYSTISVKFIDETDSFSIVIRDNGTGFDEKLLPKLTTKFMSSNITNEYDKHGLGLWIVQKIVTANNGTLYLRNYCENDGNYNHKNNAGAEVKMIFRKNK